MVIAVAEAGAPSGTWRTAPHENTGGRAVGLEDSPHLEAVRLARCSATGRSLSGLRPSPTVSMWCRGRDSPQCRITALFVPFVPSRMCASWVTRGQNCVQPLLHLTGSLMLGLRGDVLVDGCREGRGGVTQGLGHRYEVHPRPLCHGGVSMAPGVECHALGETRLRARVMECVFHVVPAEVPAILAGEQEAGVLPPLARLPPLLRLAGAVCPQDRVRHQGECAGERRHHRPGTGAADGEIALEWARDGGILGACHWPVTG